MAPEGHAGVPCRFCQDDSFGPPTCPRAFLSAGHMQVGHQLVGAYTACMGLPLFRKRISGSSSLQELGYTPTAGDEVEDLYLLLAYIKECIPGVQAVASGAIASDYQRLRVENVCSRLNLVSLAYLWHQPQRLLLRCAATCATVLGTAVPLVHPSVQHPPQASFIGGTEVARQRSAFVTPAHLPLLRLRTRSESPCSRCVFPRVFRGMVQSGLEAILVKVRRTDGVTSQRPGCLEASALKHPWPHATTFTGIAAFNARNGPDKCEAGAMAAVAKQAQ